MTKKYKVQIPSELKNYVEKKQGNKSFNYEENVKDFTGLIFHCPDCDAEFHLHIAQITLVRDLVDFARKEKKNG